MEALHGLLVIDKPAGITSHDVVSAVRRLLHIQRVGHGGTLDPMATGVLVVLIGAATRLSQFVVGHDKRYEAVIRLGISTTTYDAEGEVTGRRAVAVDEGEIHHALSHFEGEIAQVPPMYAAIKVDGRKLYDLARKGQEIAREPRPVTIHALHVVQWAPPDLHIDVTCSAGTYIRSLAHDLGESLGCGAHLSRLRRTRSGPFSIDLSCSLDHLREHAERRTLSEVILPPAAALQGMALVRLDPEQERDMRHGKQLALQTPEAASFLQARDAQDGLIGVLARAEGNTWQPRIVLPPRD